MTTLDEVMSDKRYPDGTFTIGHSYGKDFYRIPTGIFALDYCIGGGFPVGVTSSVYGPPGGGKTLVGMKLASGAQQLCYKCFEYSWDCKCKKPHEKSVVIVTTEIFDMDWAVLLGVDPDRTVVVEPDSGEQAADIIVGCLRATDCGLVFLDSLPMLVPTVEMESSHQDQQVASQAKLIAKLIRTVKQTLLRQRKLGHHTAFVCTNQIRAKIGGFGFGPQESVPGGYTSKHDWHLTMRMSQLKPDEVNKDTDLPMNAKFKISTVAMGNKRKVFTLSGAGEFYVVMSDGGPYWKGTINDFKTVARYAEESGLLTKEPWKFLDTEYQRKADILESWSENAVFLTAKKKIIDKYKAEAKAASGLS